MWGWQKCISFYLPEKINIDPASLNKNNIEYNIDTIEDGTAYIKMRGWAYIKNMDAGSTGTSIILRGKDGNYRVPVDIETRKDVVSYFKNPLLEQSGFVVQVTKAKLPTGIFSIGIEKTYLKDQQRSVVFSDKILKIGIPVPKKTIKR
jgi:hypothetical protein